MCVFLSILYISSSAGERAVVGVITGLMTVILVGIITRISRKKIVKKELKEKENTKARFFIDADVNAYYRLLHKELFEACHPCNFMQPYDHDKVMIANDLFSKLQDDNMTVEVFLEIRRQAEKQLGVQLSAKHLFSLLKEVCNPRKYMSPYDKDRIEKANDLYCDVLNNEHNLAELERIGDLAKAQGFLAHLTNKSENTSLRGDCPKTDEEVMESPLEVDKQALVIGKWHHSGGKALFLVKGESPDLFVLIVGKDDRWEEKATLSLIKGSLRNKARGASFADLDAPEPRDVYKISKWGFLPSLKVVRNGRVVKKYSSWEN